MAVRELQRKPDPMRHFPDTGYRFLELHDGTASYGHAAIREYGSDLELHLTLARWGPEVRRALAGDMEWLKAEARRLGMHRILGVRIDSQGKFDRTLFRFARLYGFTDALVVQTVALSLL